MYKPDKFKPIIIKFRTPNGNQWEEQYSTRMLDIFKKDKHVIEIRDRETDNIIYSKEGK